MKYRLLSREGSISHKLFTLEKTNTPTNQQTNPPTHQTPQPQPQQIRL